MLAYGCVSMGPAVNSETGIQYQQGHHFDGHSLHPVLDPALLQAAVQTVNRIPGGELREEKEDRCQTPIGERGREEERQGTERKRELEPFLKDEN